MLGTQERVANDKDDEYLKLVYDLYNTSLKAIRLRKSLERLMRVLKSLNLLKNKSNNTANQS